MKYTFKPRHVVPAFLFVVAVLYGGSKPPCPTNPPPMMLGLGPRPTTYATLANWSARGAYCDWQRIEFRNGFAFPVGTNFIDGVTLFAYGELKSNLHCSPSPSTFTCSLPSRVSLEPGVSSVTHGLTPSNSYLFAWHNACVERCATNRVDASIELFRSGACSVRFGNVETTYPAPVPPDFHGIGQDDDWIRATFPAEATNILARGYNDWLLGTWTGINAENGHALVRVTIDPSAFNQAPSTLHQTPIYLVCGPYRVNVTEPGTYGFPIEVLTAYEVRTYPTPVPLTFEYDDGYRGDYGPSFEVEDRNHPAPRPRLMMANPIRGLEYIYDFFMKPRIIAVPDSVPLQYAVGTKFDLFCNAVRQGDYTFSELSDTLVEILTATKAEIKAARRAELIEIRSRAFDEEMFGYFEIIGSFPTNEVGFITNRVDATIFSGDQWHTESLGNRRASHHLTAVTQHDSTAPVTVSHTHAMAEGQSAYVAVYMASTEPDANPAYDDSISWSVTSNGGGSLSGSTSVFGSSSALANAVSWVNELYGVEYDPLFLGGQMFTAPSDDVLRLSLTATAQNATDGLRETCVQLVIYPVDANGNPIGLPTWANQN